MWVSYYSMRYLFKKRINSIARLLSLSMGIAVALLQSWCTANANPVDMIRTGN